jgi:hypothetical protein
MLESYHFVLISVSVVFFYFLTLYLQRIEKISLLWHRRLWNLVLLASFIISGILGLFMTFAIDFDLPLKFYSIILWLHVEAGIVMAIISIFHALWHLRYYFPRKK